MKTRCEMKFYKLEKKLSKATFEFKLIVDGDKILIGLSCGNESLALVELLGSRLKMYKPKYSVV